MISEEPRIQMEYGAAADRATTQTRPMTSERKGKASGLLVGLCLLELGGDPVDLHRSVDRPGSGQAWWQGRQPGFAEQAKNQ